MVNISRIARFVAIAGVVAGVSSAHAGISGWDIVVTWGDNSWSALDNLADFSISQTGEIYTIQGSGETSDWTGAFTLQFDPDPFVSSSFTINNMSGGLLGFSITVLAPSIALSSPTTMTGSVSGTVGDGDGQADPFGMGATVQTLGFPASPSAPYYEALVDGADVRSLYTAPARHQALQGLTATIPTENYLNEVGPAVVANIGIRNSFELTNGDNASFTSTFFIVPTPGALALAGLAGIAAIRRRR